MDVTEYREWAQKAQAMTEDQQRACIHNFADIVLIEEVWARMSWLSTYHDKQAKLTRTFSMDNYHEGPFVESAYIRKLFYGVPQAQEAQAIEESNEVEVNEER